MLKKAEKVTFPALKKLQKVTFEKLDLEGPSFLKATEAYKPAVTATECKKPQATPRHEQVHARNLNNAKPTLYV